MEPTDLQTKKEEAFSGISLRSFLTVVLVLVVILALCSGLSYLVPQGSFQRDDQGIILTDTYEQGTVSGIAAEAVRVMLSLGCELPTICAAIGPHIGYCCYEVGADFYETVCGLCGAEFAGRHITIPAGKVKHHANLTSMNVEILTNAGVTPEKIDVSSDCTMCMNDIYYSHRATAGKRGVHGAGIGIR